MSHYHFQPIQGQGRTILDTVLASPEFADCTLKEKLTFRLVCEEIIMNVIFYAYPDDVEGFLDVDVQKTPEADVSGARITINFADGGVPFNPLERKKPDTTLPWKLRNIGGLGIFLVIKKMDDVRYKFVEDKNVLTIEKIIR